MAAGHPELAADRIAPLVVAAEQQQWIPVLAQGLLVAGECELIAGDQSAGYETLSRAATLAELHGMPGIARRAHERLPRLSTD